MEPTKRKKEHGFSLVELLIVMAIFITVIALSSHAFNQALMQSKQESKKVESQVEGIVGMEMMRIDVEHAGYGLPWTFGSAIGYTEATSVTPGGCSDAANSFNDANNPPRALVSLDGSGGRGCLHDSDYFVVKSTVAGRSQASQEWSYVTATTPTVTTKDWTSEGLAGTYQVIAVRPKFGQTEIRRLVTSGATYYKAYSSIASFPVQTGDILYGVDDGGALGMPFNRADYYVRRPTTGMPSLCSPATGVLYKATVNHADGRLNELPILDCVADLQVAFGIDTSAEQDGTVDCYVNDLTDALNPLNAQAVRQRVREVRIYVLRQEGEIDRSFEFDPKSVNALLADKPCDTCLRVGETTGRHCTGETLLGRDFDLSASGGTEWKNYRWKVHTLVVKPKNLM